MIHPELPGRPPIRAFLVLRAFSCALPSQQNHFHLFSVKGTESGWMRIHTRRNPLTIRPRRIIQLGRESSCAMLSDKSAIFPEIVWDSPTSSYTPSERLNHRWNHRCSLLHLEKTEIEVNIAIKSVKINIQIKRRWLKLLSKWALLISRIIRIATGAIKRRN